MPFSLFSLTTNTVRKGRLGKVGRKKLKFLLLSCNTGDFQKRRMFPEIFPFTTYTTRVFDFANEGRKKPQKFQGKSLRRGL